MNDRLRSINKLLEELEQEEARVTAIKKSKAKIVKKLIGDLKSEGDYPKQETLKRLSQSLGIDEFTEQITRLLTQSKVPLYGAASFKRMLVQATHRRQTYKFQPEWRLNNKHHAYAFVDELGIRRPKVFSRKKKLDQIPLELGSVLKPENGSSSHGVFILGGNGQAQEVRTGDLFNSYEMVKKRARHYINGNIVKADQWFLEEFVGDFKNGVIAPARDLKFYCFYGEVGLVLEVDRSSSPQYCEWLPSGEVADTGRYKNKIFKGEGFNSENLRLAEKISLEIPVPFMRIDFLKTQNSFFFCEFTPRPGQFDSFSAFYDNLLGSQYLAAESRLHKDLLNGKSFSFFNNI